VTTTITMSDASGFFKGDYIQIDDGGLWLVTQEQFNTTLTVISFDWYARIFHWCVKLTRWISQKVEV